MPKTLACVGIRRPQEEVRGSGGGGGGGGGGSAMTRVLGLGFPGRGVLGCRVYGLCEDLGLGGGVHTDTEH